MEIRPITAAGSQRASRRIGVRLLVKHVISEQSRHRARERAVYPVPRG